MLVDQAQSIEQVQNIMAKYHDFNEMVDFYKRYNQQFEIYSQLSELKTLGLTSKTRKRFAQIKKQEIRLHYAASGTYAETGRVFDLNESIVRGVAGAHPIADKRLSSKGNAQGAGRPLSYPGELEDELLKWILVLRDLYFPVSVLNF